MNGFEHRVPTTAALLSGSPKAGEVRQVEHLAAALGRAAERVREYQRLLVHAEGTAASARSAAVSALREKVRHRLLGGAELVREAIDAAMGALQRYASHVHHLHREADRTVRELDDERHTIGEAMGRISEISQVIGVRQALVWNAVPPGRMPDPMLGDAALTLTADEREAARHMLAARYDEEWLHVIARWHAALEQTRALRDRHRALVEEREAAERDVVRGCEQTPLGHLLAFAQGDTVPAKVIAVGLTGEHRGDLATVGRVSNTHPLLFALLGRQNGGDVWSVNRTPAEVAAAWAALTPHEQEALIRVVPGVIGNLVGLDASVRDRANRLHLAALRERAHLLRPDQLQLLGETQRILSRADAQVDERGIAAPPIQLLALHLAGDVPMAAVVYGDADRAVSTTWVVPGMDNDAPAALGAIDEASLNVYDAQRFRAGDDSAPAVVAWVSYDTPGRPDEGDLGVLSSASAMVGARRLAAELDGMFTARAAAGRDAGVVSVLSHSYGTTVASIALTKVQHPVDRLVMLGSAGLDPAQVPSLDALRVATLWPGQRAVFTTHASADQLAPLGAALGGRAQPNPDATTLLNLQLHSPVIGGALVFSSEGNTDLGLLPTDGHSLLGEGDQPSPLGIRASSGHGYLDPRTQSLSTIASLTAGHIDTQLARSLLRTETARVEYVTDIQSGIMLPERKRVAL